MQKLQTLFLMLFLFIGISLNAAEPGVQVGIMTTGTKSYIGVVGEADAIKVGTSSVTGNMYITLPANAKEVSFYIGAWAGKPGNVIITDSLTTDTIAVLDIIADVGIAKNGNDNFEYTLIGEEESFLNTLALTPQDSKLVLKIESGTAKRFVVWSPEYEVEDNGGVTSGVSNLKVNNVTKYIDNYGKLCIKRNDDIYSIYGSKMILKTI